MLGYDYTERLRTVLLLAREEATRLKHEYVGTEHLLLGLLREGEGVGMAALKALNVNLADVSMKIRDTVLQGKNETRAAHDLPFTSRAHRVLELAADEAKREGQTSLGTQHLLMGMLREEKGIAAQVLTHGGATEETARAEIQRIMGKAPARGAGTVSASSPARTEFPAVPWPAELDALTIAPKQHWLLLENDRVRVLDTMIEPGEVTPVHTHKWPAAHYVLSWSDFVRRDPEGNVLLDTRTIPELQSPPSALWGEPIGPHTLENVGATPLHIISVELKR